MQKIDGETEARNSAKMLCALTLLTYAQALKLKLRTDQVPQGEDLSGEALKRATFAARDFIASMDRMSKVDPAKPPTRPSIGDVAAMEALCEAVDTPFDGGGITADQFGACEVLFPGLGRFYGREEIAVDAGGGAVVTIKRGGA